MTTWEKVGVIGIDDGTCLIGSPLGVLNRSPKDLGAGRDEFIERLNDRQQKGAAQWNFDGGNAGLGVTVSTGGGDGTYDVLVRRAPNGAIAEVKVVFLDTEDAPTPEIATAEAGA